MRLDQPSNIEEIIEFLMNELRAEGTPEEGLRELAINELVADGVIIILPD